MLRFEEVSTEDATTSKAPAPAPVAPVAPAATSTLSTTTETTAELPRSNLRHKLLLKLQAGRWNKLKEPF